MTTLNMEDEKEKWLSPEVLVLEIEETESGTGVGDESSNKVPFFIS